MAEQGGRGGELPENGIFGGVTDGNIDIVAAGSVGFEVEVVAGPRFYAQSTPPVDLLEEVGVAVEAVVGTHVNEEARLGIC